MVKKLLMVLAVLVCAITTTHAGCRTDYWVVPASFLKKMVMTIDIGTDHLDAEGNEITISKGTLDPAKYYRVMQNINNLGNYAVGKIIYSISANITDKGVIVKELSSIYFLTNNRFEATICATTNGRKKVIKLISPRRWIKEVKQFIQDDDVTSEQAQQQIKIQNAYIGKDLASVFARFSYLAGGTWIGEDYVLNFDDTNWSCE